MSKVKEIIQHAETSCKSHGARLTDKRKQILSGLLESDKAMSAYELVDYCKEKYGEALPPMSVYRILDFLQEEGLVHKINLANKYIACGHITCDHAHGVPQFLICGDCQQVKEVMIDKNIIDDLNRNVAEAGFHVASPQLEINCICNSCNDKKN